MFERVRSIPKAANMPQFRVAVGVVALSLCRIAAAQDLAPRAYVITPIHSNAVVTSYSFYTGNLDFAGGLPITDATATANLGNLSYFHSMRTFGRTADPSPGPPLRDGRCRGAKRGDEPANDVFRAD